MTVGSKSDRITDESHAEKDDSMAQKLDRRTFVKSGAVLAAGLATSQAYGANERVRLAFVGVGNRGGQLIGAACNHADMQAAAVCDVYAPYREKWAADLKCPGYGDWRELLDKKDVDAIVIAAPDHWHALMTIAACRASSSADLKRCPMLRWGQAAQGAR